MPFRRETITRPAGVVTDLSPYELPNEVWTSADNADFDRKRSSTCRGWEEVYPTLSNQAVFALPWTDFNMPYWFVATATSIFRMQYDKLNNVTRETEEGTDIPYNGQDGWNGANFNGAVVFNNGYDAPQYYNTSSARFSDLTAWPEFYSCAIVRPFKNYLVALDITKDTGQRFPVMVKWSDPADAGGVPLSWDETSAETQAGEALLPDTSGRAIDGLALNDNFFIYKADSVWAMTFIGGTLVFQFRRVFADDGIMGQDCAVEVEGKHYVVGTNDIYMHDGTRKQSIVDGVTRHAIYSDIHPDFTHRVKAVSHPPTSELWVYYPDLTSTAGECNQAWVFNWEQGVWGKRDIPECRYIHLGAVDTRPSEHWDDANFSWNGESSLIWGQEEFGPSNVDLVAVTDQTLVHINQPDTYDHDGEPYTTVFERHGINFGDDENVKYIHSITPHCIGTGTIQVQVGGEFVPEEGVYWEDPVPFELDVDKECHFRHSSRYLAVKFYASSADAQFTLTGYTIEFEETDQR